MTSAATWEPLTGMDPVMTIAQDLFTTMIDGEPGHLSPWLGDTPVLEDPRYAWVDVDGPVVTRVMLMAGRATGENLTRCSRWTLTSPSPMPTSPMRLVRSPTSSAAT
jgi:chemotaxis protein CheX